jgi:hypothetical protein
MPLILTTAVKGTGPIEQAYLYPNSQIRLNLPHKTSLQNFKHFFDINCSQSCDDVLRHTA